MTTPINPLPTPPSPADSPVDFNTKAFALLGAMPAFVTEANAQASGLDAAVAAAGLEADAAALKAGEALTSANNAAISKTGADSARDDAVIAKNAAEAALDSFDDRYLGAKASAPATDNDGGALLTGALYWDTALPGMRSWNGAAWVTLPAATAAAISSTPAGSIAATTVQGAINELAEINVDLAAATGASLVGVIASGAGALVQTQATVNALVTHADRYGTLLAAINATPLGGTLQLGLGPYASPGTVVRSHIRIIGQKMPWVNAGRTALVGGTIIKGQFLLDGDGITCEDFGVDSGSDWCTASNGGAAANAFVAHEQNLAAVRVNNHFKNIIGLCQNASAAFHAVLIEGQQFGSSDNIHGWYGQFGVVFKCSDYEIGKATGYENGQSNVTIKSDSYAPVTRVNAACLSGVNLVTSATHPIAVHSSTAPLADVNIAMINVTGGQRQVRIISNISGVNIVDNVNVGTVNARGATQVGLDTYGIIYQSNFAVANIVNACGYGVNTQVNANGVHFGQINYVDTASLNKFDAINLGGKTSFDNIIATNAYSFTAPTGINVTTGVGSTVCRVGNYVGRLNLNGGSMLNGWEAFGAPGAMLRGNRVHLFGRVHNAANKGAGKDNIMSINAALTGGVARVFVVSAYNGGNLDQGPTIVVIVAADGTVSLPQQNTLAFDAAKISQIPLDGIFWDLDEPAH